MSRAWPLPALLAWGACWAACLCGVALGVSSLLAFAVASLFGVALAFGGSTPWRSVFIAGGFPLSFAASGMAGSVPAWAWLLPLAALLLCYPIGTWRDAPMFPTPKGALRGLSARLDLAPGARVLDAGCGLGDALLELHREYPKVALTGLEWSWPLRLLCALRCRFASVRRADIWTADWSGYDLVYVFQRPETMHRATEKAARELRPGAWLASLEFESGARKASDVFTCADGRPLWIYRQPN